MPADDEFQDFFAELFPAAYRLAWRLAGDVTVAEDIAAEALARVFVRWPRVRALEHREAWVLRVTTNLAIDQLRRRTPTIQPPSPTDEADAVTIRLALAAALKTLPGRQREVVVLRHLQGYTQDEVADALGVSPETVKTHLRRALEALRHKLGDEFGRTNIAAT